MALRDRRTPADGVVDVVREPIGPALIISTWNGPVLSLAMKVVPALLAGNPVVGARQRVPRPRPGDREGQRHGKRRHRASGDGACAPRLVDVTLELGGKSAAVIADDIPLAEVVPSFNPRRITYQGQICAALTRLIVLRER